LSFWNATVTTPAAQFVLLHPVVAIVAGLSLALTALGLISNLLCWRRLKFVVAIASLFGWATVVLCLALGVEIMLITRIAATRPGLSREAMAGLRALATREFLTIASAGLLLGMPGVLVGIHLDRRHRVSAAPSNSI
jgi:hypothetical protein